MINFVHITAQNYQIYKNKRQADIICKIIRNDQNNIIECQMDDKQTHKLISQAIISSIAPQLATGPSKLQQLQQFYREKRWSFTNQISAAGRSLTKKIFATDINCVNISQNKSNIANQSNLIGLAFIMLYIAFQDQYVMRLTIQQINGSLEWITKMLKVYNPYKMLQINAQNLQKIFVGIIIKINNNRNTYKISEILKQNPILSIIFSIFLRTILIKVNYNNSQNLKHNLQNTQQIYSILCDYFDLNIIAHRAATLRKKNKIKNMQQQQINKKAQIYLFADYNLFISTADNQQFCFGRFYSNQTELLNSQEELRKSMIEYLMKCKQANQKQRNDQQQQNQDKFQIMRTSGYDIDLGMSTSGLGFNGQGQTPYFSNFSNSNADTPEFGNILDSLRFRRSIDFQTAAKLAENSNNNSNNSILNNNNHSFVSFNNNANKTSIISNPRKQSDLGIVQQELCSPGSDGDKLFMMKQSYTHYFCEEQQAKQLNFQKNKQIIKTKITSIPSSTQGQKKMQDEDVHNKPRSPPSVQRKPWDSSRELTFQQNKYFISILKQQREKQQNNQKEKQQQRQNQKKKQEKSKQQTGKNSNRLEMNLKIPEIGKKSMIDNSDLRSQSRVQNLQCERQFKQFVNLSVKESQHFLKIQQNMEVLTASKRRQLSSRKYSAHQAFNNQLKQLKLRQKNVVHYSNHFTPTPEQEQNKSSNLKKDNIEQRKNTGSYWQQAHSDNMFPSSPKNKPNKMGFSSNIINFQFANNNLSKSNQKIKNDQKKSKSVDKEKKKLIMSKRFEQFKVRMAALRNSKSSRSPKSPRKVNQLSSTVGLSRHLSQKYQNKPSLFTKKNQVDKKTPIHKQTYLVSTLKLKQPIKDMQNKNNRKNSKFPEFLRNCKSRKTINQQDQAKNNTNQIGYSKQISNTQSRNTNIQINLKQNQIKLQRKKKRNSIKQKNQSTNQLSYTIVKPLQKQQLKYLNNNMNTNNNNINQNIIITNKNNDNSQTNFLQVADNKLSPLQIYQPQKTSIYLSQPQSLLFNKTKHTKSQPQLFPNDVSQLQNLSNKNMIIHDLKIHTNEFNYNERPWQYFGRIPTDNKQITKSSLCLQNKNNQIQGNFQNVSVRYSCPANNNGYERSYSQNKNVRINQQFIPYQQPNAFINYNQRNQILKNPQQYQNYPFINFQGQLNQQPPLQPQPRTTTPTHAQNTQIFNPNYGLSSIKFIPYSQTPPAQPTYLPQPKIQQLDRQKIKTAVSSNVFSTKADSPSFFHFGNQSQFLIRAQQFKQQLADGRIARNTPQ